jgi:hypothetical protein
VKTTSCWQLTKLADKGEIRRSFRQHVRPIVSFARQELSGDEWHQARNAHGVIEELRRFFRRRGVGAQMPEDLESGRILSKLNQAPSRIKAFAELLAVKRCA